MNTLFGQLDKNKIPHGILNEYGMEFTGMHEFEGVLNPRNYTNIDRVSEIYKTLLSGRIKNVTTGFVTPTAFKNNFDNSRKLDTIAVTGLYFKYSKFKDNALTNNLLTYTNNKFYDKYTNGVWQNPYDNKQTFAMAPATQNYDGLSFYVIVPSTIFYSNYSNQIQSIAINFDDGNGYVNTVFNQNIALSYTSAGTKTWTYKLTLTDNSILYSHSKIKINNRFKLIPYGTSGTTNLKSATTDTIYEHKRITAIDTYLGGKASVNLTIDYIDGNTTLTKPLIVAEGFDPGAVISPENLCGFNSYDDFQRSLNISGELRDLIRDDATREYDIIYVDWENGVDYMERNAYALQEVIKWVNQEKVGNAQNVILGQSMGGVITRWALADMEERSLPHDTRLFISHDAPQQGANIPLSLQYFYRHLNNTFQKTGIIGSSASIYLSLTGGPSIGNYLSLLDKPATQQLLKNRSTTSYTLSNNMHNTFYNQLKQKGLANSNGYPTLTRNIAISNGSECGTIQDFNPGDNLLSINYTQNLSYLQNLAVPLVSFLGFINLNPGDLILGTALNLLSSGGSFNFNFIANSLNYSSSQIYSGNISYTRLLFGFISITSNFTNLQKNKPSGLLPFDTYSGGYYDTSVLVNNINLSGISVRNKFGFIPTSSALDIGKNNVALVDADYKSAYVGANPPIGIKSSPFDNFFTDFDLNPNSRNKAHISFNTLNGNWLADELENNSPQSNCSFVCGNNEITGSDSVCTSGTYSVNTTANITWSIIEGFGIANLSTVNNNTTNLNQIGTNSGYVTLQASANSVCDNVSITKRIYVGAPETDYVTFANGVGEFDYFCSSHINNSYEIFSKFFGSTHQIRLKKYPNLNTVYTSGTNSGDGGTLSYTPSPGWYLFEVRRTNSCGTSNWVGFEVEFVDCTIGGGGNNEEEYRVSPNPTSETLSIKKINKKQKDNNSFKSAEIENTTYKLYNFNSKLIAKGILKDQAVLDVSNYKKGKYILKITSRKNAYTKQIIIN